MTDEVLNQRLLDHEDNWTERKESFQRDEIRRQLVGFANSVPEGEEAILFIGVSDKGDVPGVGDNPAETQKKISKLANESCYPPVRNSIRALRVKGETVLAVIIGASHDRPHFAGLPYIRQGSETKSSASDSIYAELIASRSSKAWPLVEAKRRGETVTVNYLAFGRENWNIAGPPLQNCAILEVTPQWARFEPTSGGPVDGSWDRIQVSRGQDGKLRVTIDGV